MLRLLQRFRRALRLRCPNCGGGPLLIHWFKLAQRCPGCGLLLERSEGDFLGGMTINLVIGEAIPVGAMFLTWLLTRPTPPWLAIEIGGIIGAILVPLLFFPFSRTIWLALDLSAQPVQAHELTDSGAAPAADPLVPHDS